jgi:hypothetical protein
MKPSADLDVARDRWRRKHEILGFPDPNGRDTAAPAGLASRIADLSIRIMVLHADPFSTDLVFDEEFWAWWSDGRPAPFGRAVTWTETAPSTDAAVKARAQGDGWATYLAVHRHGGVEMGTEDVSRLRDGTRVFRLVRTVGLVWLVLDAQAHVLQHVEAQGPWEVTVAVHGTKDSYLGGLGEGWSEPWDFAGWSPRPCAEPHIIIRRELAAFPTAAEDIRDLSLEMGGRLEDAWGMKQRRFLNHRGDLEGEIDLRRWEL